MPDAAWLTEVEDRHAKGASGDGMPSCCGLIADEHREEHATRAVPEDMGLLDTGDRTDNIERFGGRCEVVVDAPDAVLGPRVAPHDGVDLDAARHGILDEAAAGGEVPEVVLVDRGRQQHERQATHGRRHRRVVDELEHRRAMDDHAWGAGDILANDEGVFIDLRGEAAVGDEVSQEVGAAVPQRPAARREGRLDGLRIAVQGVGGRQRRGDDAHDEATALPRAPIDLVIVDQVHHFLLPREVGQGPALVDRVVLPGAVAEAPVTRWERLVVEALQETGRLLGEIGHSAH
jgi:hypothetical protein